tara:strand:- start:453 stop:689 length:237 start_codon:yes stop_codon:yes gene_type:complete
MKTPHAILIGLVLIAAALFFREPSVSPAQAGITGDVDGLECGGKNDRFDTCFILHGNKITRVRLGDTNWYEPTTTTFR